MTASAAHNDIACPVCARLGEFIEIENAQDPADWDQAESFPAEAKELQVPNDLLAQYYRYKNERLLKCARCGTYYWYRQWAPGGSEDVLHTYIHESIRRLGVLEAHVELHDALYQAHRRAEEYGGSYVEEYKSVRQGVEAEKTLLRARHGEIVSEAIDSITHKYGRSEQLAETLALISPHLDHSQQLAEARARDQARAVYHASVLAEYLAYAQASEIPPGLVRRLVCLLTDDTPQVRQTVRDALLHVFRGITEREEMVCDLAREIAQATEPLAPRYAELEELVAACRERFKPPPSS